MVVFGSTILKKLINGNGTSIGANCAEAKSAQSTKDFISKYEIAQTESNEFLYWCEVFVEAELVKPEKFALLIQEIIEIKKILAASIRKLKTKL
ncbi:MAG: hypothetical protein RLZZ574_68 [Cyanobacteriota bacterium]|jgi:four helix bundle protein